MYRCLMLNYKPLINGKSIKQKAVNLYTHMYIILKLLAFAWMHYSAHSHTTMI